MFFIKRKRDFSINNSIIKPLLLLLILGFYQCVIAHEMWLEPVKFEIAKGDKLLAHEKVGQNFKGNKYAYLRSSYEKLNYTINDITHPLSPRLGSLPAIQQAIEEEGLLILSAMTTRSKLTYKDRKIFEKFLKTEGLEWVFKAHKERGLPEIGFTEVYRRFPKSLVKVGKGLGNDKALGFPLEWVALTNPYQVKDVNDKVELQLLWQGKPYVGVKVNVFNKIRPETGKSLTVRASAVIQTEYFTNEKGIISLSLNQNSEYLINAVKMIEPDSITSHKYNAVWESLWASMTFDVPNN